jgi:diketogulonate reductase-like aldo/keto reductase
MIFRILNNGFKIPVLGTGTNTFGKENKDFFGKINFDTKELKNALELGYRLIDTAIYYRNESVVGKVIKESNIDRSEFFITSKIPEKKEYTESDDLVKFHIFKSIKSLGVDYIDLYLMHFPLDSNDDNLRVWKVLESFVEKGLIRSIGVSNFNEEQLSFLIKNSKIKPTVNQFQSFPGRHQQSLIDFCKRSDIIPEAYHSIAKINEVNKGKLIKIAKKYNKSWTQIVLNYQVNEGLVAIPKSHNPIHQSQNIDIFDFKLSVQDINSIRSM